MIFEKNIKGNSRPNRAKTFTKIILAGIGILTVGSLSYHSMLGSGGLSTSTESSPFAMIVDELATAATTITSENPTTRNTNDDNSSSDWPGQPVEAVGHPLVSKGTTFVKDTKKMLFERNPDTGKILMDEFLEIYEQRPDKINLCGIRINHAIGLFLTVRYLKPTLVVESGVNAGQSTYFIRKASPTTKIWALDPLAEPICKQGTRWMDDSELTTYFTGDKFVDLGAHDYIGMIEKGEIDPEKTLIFIDDHLDLLRRLPPFYKAGIRHILVEDNYKMGEGATPGDQHGTPKHLLSAPEGHKRRKDGEWLFQNLIGYAEFPPLVPPIMAKENNVVRKKAGGFMVASDTNHDIVAPILRPDLNEEDKKIYEDIAKRLGHDPRLRDNESYMQFMNYNNFLYMELLPMAPDLISFFSTNVYKYT